MKKYPGVDRRWVLKTAAGMAADSCLPCRAKAAHRVDLSFLQRRFRGILVLPESNAYDRERRCFTFNPDTDKHPVAIAKCTSEEDIVVCLEFAQGTFSAPAAPCRSVIQGMWVSAA